MKKILFVCLGNICRSPGAEGILKKYIKEENLENNFQIESAGLLDYHEGENYDSRMIAQAAKRGYNLDGTSRPFINDDFEKFDYIIALDNEIYKTLLSFDKKKKYTKKLFKMIEFYSKKDYDEVPDPYYFNSEGFELVLDILEDACNGLFNKLKNEDI